MVQAVSRDESYGDGFARRRRGMLQDRDWRRWLSPWRVDIEGGRQSEAWQRGNPSAAYDGNVNRRCRPGKHEAWRREHGRLVPSYVLGTPAILRYGMEMFLVKIRGLVVGIEARKAELTRASIH